MPNSRLPKKPTGVRVGRANKTVAAVKRATGRPHARDKVGREAIVAATINLLKHVEPETLSLAQVASAAGVARPLITYYFDDLHALLHEVTEVLMLDLQNRMRNDVQAPGTIAQKIRRRLGLRLAFMREHPYFERLASRQTYWNNQPTSETGQPQVLERGMAMTRALLEGVPLTDVQLRHLHVTIVGISAYLETGKPIMDALFGTGSPDNKNLDQYLDFVAQLLASHIQTSPPSRKRSR